MATLDNNSFWDFKGIEEYNDGKLLIRTPYPVALILISYLWFVLKVGPNYMKNRPPLNLRYMLVAYNAFQVVITFITFTMGIRALWNVGLWHTKCYVDEDLEKRLLVQFCLMFIHVVVSHYISECRPAYYLVSSVCFNTILFIYLFGDFYVKSYMKKRRARDIANAGKMISSNITSKSSINYIINHHKLAGKVN
ncbi:unnamed protein product [Arctia plantaginis]|uniref:Elongation of very long chain fatty acids protein n=1 Tax=Arctia plantaginis TaxID=874455 RepID=A0A8S0YQR8_ARCPL|nr:unnamed protein product [Arctia plantaginis]